MFILTDYYVFRYFAKENAYKKAECQTNVLGFVSFSSKTPNLAHGDDK